MFWQWEREETEAGDGGKSGKAVQARVRAYTMARAMTPHRRLREPQVPVLGNMTAVGGKAANISCHWWWRSPGKAKGTAKFCSWMEPLISFKPEGYRIRLFYGGSLCHFALFPFHCACMQQFIASASQTYAAFTLMNFPLAQSTGTLKPCKPWWPVLSSGGHHP